MEITPAGVRKKEFRTVLRGADKKEVRDFLYEVAAALESLVAEREMLKRQLADLEERAAEFRHMEQVLQETLSRAQETADQLRRSALEDAERIRKEAKEEAEVIANHSREELESLKATIRSLHGQKIAFLQEMDGILESYGRILERLKKESIQDETAD